MIVKLSNGKALPIIFDIQNHPRTKWSGKAHTKVGRTVVSVEDDGFHTQALAKGILADRLVQFIERSEWIRK